MNQTNIVREYMYTAAIMVAALVLTVVMTKIPGNNYISFPEEPITTGDSLIMYEQGDTTCIGFYHSPLRGGEKLLIVK